MKQFLNWILRAYTDPFKETENSYGVGPTFGKVVIENGYVEYKGPYISKHIKVRLSDLSTVTVTPSRFGKAYLNLVGHATSLAVIELPYTSAHGCQEWLLERINT